VSFRKAEIDIDPNKIGKGYAVDKMIEKLKEHEIKSALVSAGGSSIYGLGTPPNDTAGWTVRIRHPRKWSETVQELQLKDTLSTRATMRSLPAVEKIQPYYGPGSHSAEGALSASRGCAQTSPARPDEAFFRPRPRVAAKINPRTSRIFAKTRRSECAYSNEQLVLDASGGGPPMCGPGYAAGRTLPASIARSVHMES
jgi:hypothetical protein